MEKFSPEPRFEPDFSRTRLWSRSRFGVQAELDRSSGSAFDFARTLLNASERVRTLNVNRIIKSSIELEFLYSSQNILISYIIFSIM
jgi:hypothetical protein